MSDREVKRLTPNSIANLVMADEAWHDSLYVRAEDYDSLLADFEALRTALAAEPTKPSDDRKAMKEALRILTKPESGDLRWQVSDACDILRTALRTALAAPKQEHPGYVIGSHWLETAYSRVCAGEAEADVLRDCGWERVDEALRRDAERWKDLATDAVSGLSYIRQFYGQLAGVGWDRVFAKKAAIDAAMGEKR